MSPYRLLVVDKDGNEIILTAGLSHKKITNKRYIYIQERINNVKIGQQSLFDMKLSPKVIAHKYASSSTANIKSFYLAVRAQEFRGYDVISPEDKVINDNMLPILQDCLHVAMKDYLKRNNLKMKEEL